MNNGYEDSCSKSELEIFSMPAINIGMQRGDYSAHQPVSSLDNGGGPLEFSIASNPEQYLDLSRTRLFLKVQLVKGDGGNLGNNAKVAPVNNLLHSLFSQVDVKLQNTIVTSSFNTYPYKAYFETLFCFGEDAKKGYKTSQLWFPDKGDGWDKTDPAGNDNNPGFDKRRELTANSKTVELIGRPHVDLFHQSRYLIPGVDMHLKFIRSETNFHLMADGEFKLLIKEAKLYVRRVKINPSIALAHTAAMEKGESAKYPIRRGTTTACTIPQGSLTFHKDNLVSGQLPRRIILGFVSNPSFNGDRRNNPFRFQHFNLNYISLSTGNQSFPAQPLTPDFRAGLYLQAYENLCSTLGFTEEDRGFGVDREEFADGYTLFAFDLTADQCQGSHVDPISYGNIKIEVHFARGLPEPVNLIAYSEYDSSIKIDVARNVVTDFQL